MRPAAKFCRKALRSARTAVCLWNIQTALFSPTHPTLRHRIQLYRTPTASSSSPRLRRYPPGGNSGYGAQPNQPQSQPQPHPQQPYYGQQPQQNYGQPGNGGYIPPQQQGYPGGYPNYPQNYPNNSSNGKAIAGLVLGILSIVMGCVYGSGLLFGILGTIFSCMARKEDSSNPLQNKKNSTATSGLICSIIGIVLSVIVLLIVIIAVAVSVETGDYTTPGYYGSGDYQDACQLFFGLLR